MPPVTPGRNNLIARQQPSAFNLLAIVQTRKPGASIAAGLALLKLLGPTTTPARDTAIARTSCTFLGFYDAEGKLVENTLLAKTPLVSGTRISDEYGWRIHPIFGYPEFHEGIDVAAPYGTAIHALAAGVIEESERKGGYGLYVRVRHSRAYATACAHLSALSEAVHPGARVRRGDVLGYVGSTGCSTGNHLHLEVIWNGARVRPACRCLPPPLPHRRMAVKPIRTSGKHLADRARSKRVRTQTNPKEGL